MVPRSSAATAREDTSMTLARPTSSSSGSDSVPAPSSKKCRGASTCVPGVGAHVERRDVGAVAARQPLDGFHADGVL